MQGTNVITLGKKPFRLGEHWQSRVAEENGGKWQKPLTSRERGQLKQLANTLGARTNEVITWAISNWGKFASSAASCAGVASYPQDPHIGFLLAHCAYAVNRMQLLAEKAVFAKLSVPTLEARKVVEPEGKPYIPSPDEFAKIMAELDS